MTVQAEPTGPTYNVPLRSKGIDSNTDSEPGIQGLGESQENENERGSRVGKASPDQPAQSSSIQNVAAHIAQNSLDV